jgi:gluconate 2-dehydrogenase gamma chain
MSDRPVFSRRDLLKRVGLAGTAAVVPGTLVAAATAPAADALAVPQATVAPPTVPPAAAREAFETLTAAESDTLEAIAARLIPADATGPGAAEARAAHYIDRALGGPLAASRQAYTAGLAAVNAYAQSAKGAAFAKLQAADQDAVLTAMQGNVATGFTPNAASFFNLVRGHTIEGTFSDPYYGGNANFIGWDLIRYPGVRVSVSADEQRIKVAVPPNHRSAYDFAMFSKSKPAASNDTGGHDHGD